MPLGEAVPVAPDRVNKLWPFVKDYLQAACDRCGDWTIESLKESLDHEYSLLWISWTGTEINAAAITELEDVPRGKICRIVACGGRSALSWRDCIRPIEQFARDEGCVAVRIHGRPGWARVFTEYEIEWVALEKRLD